jgi:hypothetical protein
MEKSAAKRVASRTMRPSSIFLCAVPTAFLEVTYSTEQTERDTMRWVASSLERFRRSASIITTFLIIASIGGWVISMLLPNSHALADAATCLYFGSNCEGRDTSFEAHFGGRYSCNRSSCFYWPLFAGLVEVRYALTDGLDSESVMRLAFNGALLAIAILIVQKNTSAAKSMASARSNH